MKIYLVTHENKKNYDMVRSIIVAANNMDEAKSVFPSVENIEREDRKTYFLNEHWVSQDGLKVTLIGTTNVYKTAQCIHMDNGIC